MLAKKPIVPAPALPAKQAPSAGGLPNPQDYHKSLPADFFTRNYCKELAHNELFAYVAKVKADPSLQTVLRNIFITKAPLGAGHSNAITLWVYAGYALNNLDLDGVEDISFADLSGATITNVIFSAKHYMNIEGVSSKNGYINIIIFGYFPNFTLLQVSKREKYFTQIFFLYLI